MKIFLQNLRESCQGQTWSAGVELSRAATLQVMRASSEEIVVKISSPKSPLARSVQLWPGEDDWSCDCKGPQDPCEHIVTAAILCKDPATLTATPEHGANPTLAEIRYDLTLDRQNLTLSRKVWHGANVLPLKGSLTALAAQKVEGLPRVACSKEDFTIETMLARESLDVFPQWFWLKLFPVLAASGRAVYDGKPVVLSPKAAGLEVHVEDYGGGVRLTAKDEAGIVQKFANGFILSNGIISPYNGHNMSPSDKELLFKENFYGAKELSYLSSELLPDLETRFKLKIKSNTLPGTIDVEPRLIWETSVHGANLEAVPVIVYGDPIVARVEGVFLRSNGSQVPIRDKALEERLVEKAKATFGPDVMTRKVLAESEAVAYMTKLTSRGADITGPGPIYFRGYQELDLKYNRDFSLADGSSPVQFSLRDADGKERFADPAKVLGAWQRNERMVPLLDGGWAGLPKDLKKFGASLADIFQARDGEGKIPPSMVYDLKALIHDLGIPDSEQRWGDRLLAALAETSSSVPEIRAILRDYQLHGANWLRLLQSGGLGALLADDMGLGKTLQSICVLKPRSLVVAPSSVIFNWQKEIERFRPELRAKVYSGQNRSLDGSADVILCSYNIMRLDIEILKTQRFEVVILDEAQLIKNHTSQAAQAAFQLVANFRLCLSGTPIENRLDDIWSLFRFLNPGLLGTYTQFQDNYARPIEKGDKEKAGKLRQRLAPFTLRRLKSEVAKELPARTDMVRYCELSEVERETYQSYLLACKKEIVERFAGGANPLQVLELLLRLRQTCCHLGLLPQSQDAISSSKLDLIALELENSLASGSKVLIFSQWTQFLDLIAARVEGMGLSYLRIDGSTKNRQEVVERFQNDAEPRVMLLSLKAAGVGLNLTAADHVFIVDPWWNPAVEEQAADRAHRIGQDKPVFVRRFVAKDTVEERILLLQEEKRGLGAAVVGTTSAASKISRDDILALL